eukprot:scaffold17205_cov186-Amphora_coffeaeformis.AAC.16
MSADVVVAHCQDGLYWLEGALIDLEKNFHISSVVVYSKCGKLPTGFDYQRVNSTTSTVVDLVILPSGGRHDASYAHHLAKRYHHHTDTVFFLQDSLIEYPMESEQVALKRSFLEVSQALQEGDPFTCFQRPEQFGNEWHLRKEVWKFRSTSGPGICEFLQETLDQKEFTHLRNQDYFRVCYGGSFAVRRDRIRAIQQATWQRLASTLGRQEKGEIYQMERIWASLFTEGVTDWPLENNGVLPFRRISGPSDPGRVKAPITSSLSTQGVRDRHLENNGASTSSLFSQGVRYQPLESNGVPPLQSTNARSYPGMILVSSPLDTAQPASSVARPTLTETNSIVTLVSHQYKMSEKVMYLLDVAQQLVKQGKKVVVVAPEKGPMQKKFEQNGVTKALVWRELDPGTITPLALADYIHRETHIRTETVFWNTVIWRQAIKANLPYCPYSPRNVWVLHEASIAGENLWETVQRADSMVFAEAALGASWKDVDGLVPTFTIPSHDEAEKMKHQDLKSVNNFEQDLDRVLDTLSQRRESLTACNMMDTTCGAQQVTQL